MNNKRTSGNKEL